MMKMILKNSLSIIEMILLLIVIGLIWYILSDVQISTYNYRTKHKDISLNNGTVSIQRSTPFELFNINQICG